MKRDDDKAIEQSSQISHIEILRAMDPKRLERREGACAAISSSFIGAFFNKNKQVFKQAFFSGDHQKIAEEVKGIERRQIYSIQDGLSQEEATFEEVGQESKKSFINRDNLQDDSLISNLPEQGAVLFNYPMGKQSHVTAFVNQGSDRCHYMNPNPGGIFSGRAGGIMSGSCRVLARQAFQDIERTMSGGDIITLTSPKTPVFGS